ncbi:MAG: cytochrome P450 [Candidatus Binatia bacterium]
MDYNPFLPEVQANPYPYYTYLRQHAPVYYVPFGFWTLSRYEDVYYAFRNPQVFSSAVLTSAFLGDLNPFPSDVLMMLASDPPDHTRLRKLVNRAFTPRRIASLELHIREVVHRLIEQLPARGEFDLVRELSAPLPIITIAELLGVPPERRDDFKRWTNSMIRATNGIAVPQEEHAGIRQQISELFTYFRAAIAAYRKQPGDNLLSDMVRAEEENQMLTAEEVLCMAILLIGAGSETTTNLIANAMLALSAHPEQMAMVRANPTLIPNALEETLRYDGPIQTLFRQATQEVELSGTRIPAGSVVLLLVGSANHDERKFPEPERFDIMRNTDGHIGFGFGIHFCLGAQLARLQAKTALEALLRRFPSLMRKEEPITHIESLSVHGPKALPLVVADSAEKRKQI